jgi:hypothetical protein
MIQSRGPSPVALIWLRVHAYLAMHALIFGAARARSTPRSSPADVALGCAREVGRCQRSAGYRYGRIVRAESTLELLGTYAAGIR